MADISKIKLPGIAEELNIEDTTARELAVNAVTASIGYTDQEIERVEQEIATIPTPMQFKGTLGEGGTIISLPPARESNKGFVYKVITAGTYAGTDAKVGDIFISNGSQWVLIPSGDEPSGTVTNVSTGTGLTGGPITTSGTISVDFTAVQNKLTAGDNINIENNVISADLSAKEDTANKVSSWQTTPDDTHYPTEKLVKDSLDTEINRIDNLEDEVDRLDEKIINSMTASIGYTDQEIEKVKLPQVTTTDAGAFLRVNASGVWAKATVPNAEDNTF